MEMEIQTRNEQIQLLAETLLKTESVWTIALRLAEFLIREKEKPQQLKIPVTEEEFQAVAALFRIKGTRADGSEERRGRPKRG